MGKVGGTYINFALWAIAIVPSWFVIKEIGVSLGDRKLQREKGAGIAVTTTSDEESTGTST